jgi:hypothetical protein|tara:strand:+ start:288 stop:548 length:261 start_codon:yes stop_codon:yes gene_type:complete
MHEKDSFGEIHSKNFNIGDIVEWTSWDPEIEDWKRHYGILLTIENEIRSNRMVSVSKVMSLQSPAAEMEFFTMSLRVVSFGEDVDI